MCCKIVQESGPGDYLAALSADLGRLFQDPAGPPGRAAPQRGPWAIHRLSQAPAVDRISWGCTPNRRQHQPVSDAHLGMLLRGHAFWWPLLSQRVLVPVDGWYEPAAGGRRLPRYFHRRDGEPIYIAGIAAWRPEGARAPPRGLAIITDRPVQARQNAPAQPVVLPAEAALAWIDPATPIIDALQLACVPWRGDGRP